MHVLAQRTLTNMKAHVHHVIVWSDSAQRESLVGGHSLHGDVDPGRLPGDDHPGRALHLHRGTVRGPSANSSLALLSVEQYV